jgi:hypothetical protein
MNKILLFFIISFSFLSFNDNGNRIIHLYKSATIKISYETNQGRMDGNYISYYNNGKKKSEGQFENNYRSGSWTVWDSTGKIRMERVYENPFIFKRIITETPNAKPIDLLNTPRYTIQYNKDGFIEDFKLEEKMVTWSKRIWRYISPKENPVLFENDKFFKILYKNIFANNITPFSVDDDEFKTEISLKIDTATTKIIGYKIKEDCFFDNERFVSETRIIGICPVAFNKVKKDTTDICWIYFPEIRKCLATEKIEQKGVPSKIKTVDDLFFFRYFYGEIYKETNIYNRPIASYTSGNELRNEAERIELEMIETENNIWISLAK